MISFNTFKTTPQTYALKNNNVAFTGIKEEIDGIVNTAKTSNNSGAILKEIDYMSYAFGPKEPELVKNAINNIIDYYNSPNCHFSSLRKSVEYLCNDLLKKK